jgi:serine/threonine-protein kinase RsbT
MMLRVLSSREMPIACEQDVVLVRRCARLLAHDGGFDVFAIAAVTTAASELARNALTHGKGGRAVIEALASGSRVGLRMRFDDHGPGIADMKGALAGHSTGRSLGLGLSGSKRLVDEFNLQSQIGAGTSVTATKWARF